MSVMIIEIAFSSNPMGTENAKLFAAFLSTKFFVLHCFYKIRKIGHLVLTYTNTTGVIDIRFG